MTATATAPSTPALTVGKLPADIQAAVDSTAGYLTLQEVTLRNVNGDSTLHLTDVVLSPWEVEPYVRKRIAEGSYRYRAMLEPLTAAEVSGRRERATVLEGDRLVDGQHVSPPWPDYVGLHPEEIISRMKESSDRSLIERVRLYERAGLNRAPIMEYTPPAERAPWTGYDDWNVREILDKLPLLGSDGIQDVFAYEMSHRRRPAIVSWTPDQNVPTTEAKS